MPKHYGIASDHDYNTTHKRDCVMVWSGLFSSTYEAVGYSLPKGDGYMLTTWLGDKVRVTCPTPRTDENYEIVDQAICDAMNAQYPDTALKAEQPHFRILINCG